MNQDNSEFSYVQPYSTNSGRSDSFMDKMKMKMKDMMRSNYQDDDGQFFNEFFKSMGSSDRMDLRTRERGQRRAERLLRRISSCSENNLISCHYIVLEHIETQLSVSLMHSIKSSLKIKMDQTKK